MRSSMGSVGDAYDNAMCESFFAILGFERLNRRRFASRVAARTACFSFIEGWYNRVRLHSALGYRSPMSHEAAAEAQPTDIRSTKRDSTPQNRGSSKASLWPRIPAAHRLCGEDVTRT